MDREGLMERLRNMRNDTHDKVTENKLSNLIRQLEGERIEQILEKKEPKKDAHRVE